MQACLELSTGIENLLLVQCSGITPELKCEFHLNTFWTA